MTTSLTILLRILFYFFLNSNDNYFFAFLFVKGRRV